ncbi:MAG: hypothetical protein V7K88_26950 [Nostoc sp.]|uniref:hypothetical protein n=1 Tax=Nostoc sp. TaxID=1180 RepID=UPI002FF8D249
MNVQTPVVIPFHFNNDTNTLVGALPCPDEKSICIRVFVNWYNGQELNKAVAVRSQV